MEFGEKENRPDRETSISTRISTFTLNVTPCPAPAGSAAADTTSTCTHSVAKPLHSSAEVKARKDSEGFIQLEKWLAEFDALFLRRNHSPPYGRAAVARVGRVIFKGAAMNAPLEPAHSPFGGSVAARVLRCPASVGLVQKVPDYLRRSSAYAERGTALHAAMALLLETATIDEPRRQNVQWLHDHV